MNEILKRTEGRFFVFGWFYGALFLLLLLVNYNDSRKTTNASRSSAES